MIGFSIDFLNEFTTYLQNETSSEIQPLLNDGNTISYVIGDKVQETQEGQIIAVVFLSDYLQHTEEAKYTIQVVIGLDDYDKMLSIAKVISEKLIYYNGGDVVHSFTPIPSTVSDDPCLVFDIEVVKHLSACDI